MKPESLVGVTRLEDQGLKHLKAALFNLPPAALVEQSIERSEAILSNSGAVIVNTGQFTGRSPNDKFVIQHNTAQDDEIWWGKVNVPMPEEAFDRLHQKMLAYLQGRTVYVKDMMAGAHPDYKLPIRVITEKAWQALFSHDLFIRPTAEEQASHTPEYTVLVCPDFQADPKVDGTRSSTFILVNFQKKLVLIGGTHYAGEIKKSVFTVMNYEMPRRGVLSMHCSANVGAKGDVALFFGLSGTGKTTLSSSPDRQLIGDDEHGWSDTSIFNFEGGCYAKAIRLKPELEPLIWDACQRFGSVLENVDYDADSRKIDFDSERFTENTRGAYPLDYVANHVESGYAGHPENIFFLSADAFGVLPPISRLTPEQAMYYFLSGYTSKLAGTEKDLGSEPQATFSTCFGAPFLPLHPGRYADLLGEKIQKHQVRVWLINTGWSGGAYGTGSRIKLPYTRAMIRAALNGDLDHIAMQKDPYFGLSVPVSCPDVPAEMLLPHKLWKDTAAYEKQARGLIGRFEENFKQFAQQVPAEVVQAGPHNA